MFALLSLAMEWYAGHTGDMEATASAAVFDSTSILLEGVSAVDGDDGVILGTMDLIVFGMDSVSLVVAIEQYEAGV